MREILFKTCIVDLYGKNEKKNKMFSNLVVCGNNIPVLAKLRKWVIETIKNSKEIYINRGYTIKSIDYWNLRESLDFCEHFRTPRLVSVDFVRAQHTKQVTITATYGICTSWTDFQSTFSAESRKITVGRNLWRTRMKAALHGNNTCQTTCFIHASNTRNGIMVRSRGASTRRIRVRMTFEHFPPEYGILMKGYRAVWKKG